MRYYVAVEQKQFLPLFPFIPSFTALFPHAPRLQDPNVHGVSKAIRRKTLTKHVEPLQQLISKAERQRKQIKCILAPHLVWITLSKIIITTKTENSDRSEVERRKLEKEKVPFTFRMTSSRPIDATYRWSFCNAYHTMHSELPDSCMR